MKVALFVHCFFPEHMFGTETYTLDVARNLIQLGHDVTVVACNFQENPARESMVTRYDYQGVPVVLLDKNHQPHSRISETYWQEAMRPHLRAVLDELRPDVVHVTHLINHTAVLLDEVSRAGYPLVATLTDFFGFCFNNRLEADDGSLCAGPNPTRENCLACYAKATTSAFRQRPGPLLNRVLAGWPSSPLLRATARHGWPKPLASAITDLAQRPGRLLEAYQAYDVMIAPTEFLRDAYVRNGFPAEKLHLSRFGVDLPRRPPQVRPAGAPITIGFIGQIAPHKGPHLLLEAVRAQPPGTFAVKVYGAMDQSPDYARGLRALAGEETAFLGAFPPARMADVLDGVDLLVIPSTWFENSPLVLLNALASHTPVIVSDVAGLTEFITEGVNGWSFRRGDSADLARVLGDLAADPARLPAAAAATHYDRTSRSMTEAVLALYEDVLRLHAKAGFEG